MDITRQFDVLNSFATHFEQKVSESCETSLKADSVKIFQINIGKWCNQACRHCHVDASPLRRESMSRAVAERCVQLISHPSVETVDLTGGAPEGHEQFKYLVEQSKKLGKKVIDRCNLTILSEPGFEWLPEFLAEHRVEVVSSLPHFAARRTDKQRGNGVFESSIAGLQKLNSLGYGLSQELPLHLVYNPSGILLSASQTELQREFKTKLAEAYDISFHELYCINNLPVNRFLESLVRAEKFETYMESLLEAFNPGTIEGLMCRHQVSISHDGGLYDCDFNQMLGMKIPVAQDVFDLHLDDLKSRPIATANHCFGCTAGAGSSCGGELV